MKSLNKIGKNVKLFRPFLDTKKKKVLIKVTKNIFGTYFKDPSNDDKKYLRTKIRKLKKPLRESGIDYDQVIQSIKNLASSRETLDIFLSKTSKEIIRKNKNKISIDLKKFNMLNHEIKINIINQSIKYFKKNYYNLRSRKVTFLINNIKNKNFKKSTLGGCLFFIQNGKLCLKKEKN